MSTAIPPQATVSPAINKPSAAQDQPSPLQSVENTTFAVRSAAQDPLNTAQPTPAPAQVTTNNNGPTGHADTAISNTLLPISSQHVDAPSPLPEADSNPRSGTVPIRTLAVLIIPPIRSDRSSRYYSQGPVGTARLLAHGREGTPPQAGIQNPSSIVPANPDRGSVQGTNRQSVALPTGPPISSNRQYGHQNLENRIPTPQGLARPGPAPSPLASHPSFIAPSNADRRGFQGTYRRNVTLPARPFINLNLQHGPQNLASREPNPQGVGRPGPSPGPLAPRPNGQNGNLDKLTNVEQSASVTAATRPSHHQRGLLDVYTNGSWEDPNQTWTARLANPRHGRLVRWILAEREKRARAEAEANKLRDEMLRFCGIDPEEEARRKVFRSACHIPPIIHPGPTQHSTPFTPGQWSYANLDSPDLNQRMPWTMPCPDFDMGTDDGPSSPRIGVLDGATTPVDVTEMDMDATALFEMETEAVATPATPPEGQKRKRGRPLGSKNKPRVSPSGGRKTRPPSVVSVSSSELSSAPSSPGPTPDAGANVIQDSIVVSNGREEDAEEEGPARKRRREV